METANIPFLGIETQVEPTQSPDGLCATIKNLVPYGAMKESPLWKPIESGNNKAKGYPMSILQDLASADDSTVLSAYWHERKYKEQGATKTDTSRWLLLIKDADAVTYKMFATKVDTGVHRIDGAALCEFTAANWQSDFKFKWQKINAQDVALLVYNNTESHLFLIIGDNVYNGHVLQRHNNWIVSTGIDTYTAADFPNGGYPGYLPLADKYFAVMLVWRLETTGTYIKHTPPKIIKIDKDAANTYWPELVKDANTYIDSSTYTDRLLLNNEKSDEIKGPYLALTIGYGSRDDAFQTGNYFVIGLVESLEKNENNLFMGKVEEDKISTFPILNIDPLSHHITTGRRIGNYRNNLLLGDIMTNFHLPAAEWWFTERLTDPTLVNVLLADNYNDVYGTWTRLNHTRVLQADSVLIGDVYAPSGPYTSATTFTPVNITIDIVVEIEYNLLSNSNILGTVDLTGTGIVDSTGNVLDFIGTNPGDKTTLRITIPNADISTTAAVTITINLSNSGNGTKLEIYSVRALQTEINIATEYDLAEVTIPTEQGEFKRYQKVKFYDDGTDILLPETLSYPDRRASQLKLWRSVTPDTGAIQIDVVAAARTFTRLSGSFLSDGFLVGGTITTTGFTNGGNNTTKVIESVTALVITVTSATGLVDETGGGNEEIVSPTHWCNYYAKNLQPHPTLNLAYNTETERASALSDVTGANTTTAEPFAYTGQDTINRRPEVIRSSNLNELDLPLERTYSVKSPVVGFIDNTQETGDGQFAQFPLVILAERGIHGAESTSEIFISRIETITDDYGVHSENAFAVYKNTLWFASQVGLHILQGNNVVDIFYPLREYASQADFMSALLDAEVFIGVHEKTQEVLFTDGTTYLLVWNTEFNKWYEGTVTLGANTTGRLINVNGSAHFMRVDGGNNAGTFTNDFMATWRDGSSVVTITLTTNEISMNIYTVMKRIQRAILIGRIKSDGSGSGLSISLQGKKTVNSGWTTLVSYAFTSTTDLTNLFMRSNYGSFQVYRLVITGPMSSGTYLQSLQMQYEMRGNLLG
jgi:hypothetical protein